jgi:RNA polymerase sigma-70 factor (ECF subfamily)
MLDGRRGWLAQWNKDDGLGAMSMDDWMLMAEIGRRDAGAFRQLVARHAPWSLRFVERLVGNRATAEDLVQTAFLRIWEQADSWRPDARFSTWLYRVLHNLAIDELRAGQAKRHEALDDEWPDPREQQEAGLMRKQQDALLREALAGLPERQRTAIVLCHYEALSQQEAAQVLGISEGALESLLSRGRAALKEQVKQRWH